VAQDGIEISTLPGFGGNKEKKTLVALPFQRITRVKYVCRTKLSHSGWCRVTCSNGFDDEQTIDFKVISSNSNLLTKTIAQILKDEYLDNNGVLSDTLRLTLSPIRSTTKLLAGLILFAGLFLWSLLSDAKFFSFTSSFLLSTSLAALVIDYIRLHTVWHPLAKIVVSFFAFCIAFLLFVTAMALVKAFNFF